MDLALEISKNANRVILSHRITETIGTVYPENVRCKVKAQAQKENNKITREGTSYSGRDGFFLES